ncbi:MAG: radical SAM protein [Methanospirillaceae archaeon]|nr:radical SAM protein [Methanospirillaceae archaeon]
MLIKNTKSICPVCKVILDASIIEEDGQVYIERRCPDHGIIRHLYWSDAEMYHRFDAFESIGKGIVNPQKVVSKDTCPANCGLCNFHQSQTLLANIDLTNQCNLSCEFCFANARACGYVYEPSFDQIVDMLSMLRDQKPNPVPAVQFAGGEPTLRMDLDAIVKKARELGFRQVQLATNGIVLAQKPERAQELKDAGVTTIYLHFDGTTKETNFKLVHDLKAIEHCRNAGLGIVLVPTIIGTKNDHILGDIVRFAADNVDIIRGINFQPVSFTGACSPEALERERITIPDLIDGISRQTDNIIKKEDFYPVPCVIPISDFVEKYTGASQVRFTAHQHCGAATYVFVTDDGLVPVTHLIDVDSFFETIHQMAHKIENKGNIRKKLIIVRTLREMKRSMKGSGIETNTRFWKILGKTLISHNFKALSAFHWNAIFVGMMHFMDSYNYDVNRVKRCCIHYATPEGTLIPFCTYNSGPVYREEIWSRNRQMTAVMNPAEEALCDTASLTS